jgi:dinuclear metal center YbgI/SA1388 family protein
MPLVSDVSAYLESFAPLSLAAEWDNVGLLLGDSTSEVTSILTCLTVTREVVAEAIDTRVSLIVSHHPILFRGTKNLSTHSSEGRLLWPLASHGIAVYSPHTAFDDTREGINDFLATTLNLQQIEPLRRKESPKQVKLVVFTPESDTSKVADAIFAAGGGIIGEYRECSYRLNGTGTFFASENTNPTIGQKGHREEVGEHRLEVLCPESQLPRIVQAMRQAHSYEEPAFDVYPLKSLPGKTGSGRVGNLRQAKPLEQLAREIKVQLQAPGVQFVGNPSRPIQRIAIACGAAGEFLADAVKSKADLFLTGEMRFHDYLAAEAQEIALILPGHYATERPAVEMLANRLAKEFPNIPVRASEREGDPVQWV